MDKIFIDEDGVKWKLKECSITGKRLYPCDDLSIPVTDKELKMYYQEIIKPQNDRIQF